MRQRALAAVGAVAAAGLAWAVSDPLVKYLLLMLVVGLAGRACF